MSDSDSCCRCCTSFILTSGLSVLFIWLSLRASLPTCYIQQIYLPALNKTNSGDNNLTKNTTLFFQIKLDNKNKDKGVYYDALNLTIYYRSNQTLPIANATLPAFHRGPNKKHYWSQLITTYGIPWDEAIRSASNTSGAVFRVGLETAVRFKISFFKTKRHRLAVGADVAMNDMGTKIRKKDVKLSSSPPSPLLRRRMDLVLWTVILFYFFM
ncbi:protein NDR1-like [Impatiens glandulifera]|uniref:protein NDR1-like n=1 Tax=Impatiens glandulifera TaxID=253017 RepID=UPI001FB104E3|nr:protein NDR1-like [Impatiens glandulifera]